MAAVICFVAALLLACGGYSGWGWFLFIGLLALSHPG